MRKRTFSSIVRRVFKSQKKRQSKTLSVFVLGASKVGKSSMINVLCDEDFSDAYSPTSFDMYEKEIETSSETNNNTGIKFLFFDISGKDSLPSTRREYINKSDIFILVYAQSEHNSFKQLLRYKAEIEEVKNERISELSVAVVRNKTDLDSKDKNNEKKLAWCRAVFHCSAKFGVNISHVTDFLITESLSAGNIIEKNLNKGVSGRYIYGANDNCKSISLVQPKIYQEDEDEDIVT